MTNSGRWIFSVFYPWLSWEISPQAVYVTEDETYFIRPSVTQSWVSRLRDMAKKNA